MSRVALVPCSEHGTDLVDASQALMPLVLAWVDPGGR
jgi:hypothetical protein